MSALLSVRDLEVTWMNPDGPVVAVRGISFDLAPGETLGLVGESGSGKSTIAQAILRVLGPPAAITDGEVSFQGEDVLAMDAAALRGFRWSRISLVPQSALNALNPVLTIGAQVRDTLAAHGGTGPRAEARGAELMALVGLEPRHLARYPHELSGGMRQRVAVALALALEPALILFDEPTTALDVVVEREILKRVLELQSSLGFAMIFITHDVSLLLQFADRIGVVYSGALVELGPAEALRRGGSHPYTQGLMGAIPQLTVERIEPRGVPGAPPSLRAPPSGCRFHPRCPRAEARCSASDPHLRAVTPQHSAACHLVEPSP